MIYSDQISVRSRNRARKCRFMRRKRTLIKVRVQEWRLARGAGSMKLTPVTDVARFVSIDGRSIVRITRSLRALDAFYDPPVVEEVTDAWGTCFDESPDSFQEIGQLPDVLKIIATRDMVAAAALASPRRFAEM